MNCSKKDDKKEQILIKFKKYQKKVTKDIIDELNTMNLSILDKFEKRLKVVDKLYRMKVDEELKIYYNELEKQGERHVKRQKTMIKRYGKRTALEVSEFVEKAKNTRRIRKHTLAKRGQGYYNKKQ